MASSISIYNTTSQAATITLASLASTSARQSAVIDFGDTRPANWVVGLAAAMSSAPTAGGTLDVYIGYATATASTNFGANIGSADTTYTGYGTASQDLGKLEFVGSLVMGAYDSTNTQKSNNIGVIFPKLRYGVFIVYNNADKAISSATGNNNTLVINPIQDYSS